MTHHASVMENLESLIATATAQNNRIQEARNRLMPFLISRRQAQVEAAPIVLRPNVVNNLG